MSPNIPSSIAKWYPRGSFLLRGDKDSQAMTYEYVYVAVVTPPKFRVTWATSWGRLQRLVDFITKEKRQLWVRPIGGWKSTVQAAWYVRHAHWARLCYIPFVIWCCWTKSTMIWLLIFSSTSLGSLWCGRFLYQSARASSHVMMSHDAMTWFRSENLGSGNVHSDFGKHKT